MDKVIHIPVLLEEVLESLNLKKGETVVDCTVNRGGHAERIAELIGEKGTLVIFDLDNTALNFAKERLEKLKDGPKIIAVHTDYRHIKEVLKSHKIEKVDKVFADLGLSSEELEVSGRGFSFQKDEPLIMTFQNPITQDTLTAKDLLKNLDAKKLEIIFKNYGDETRSRKIAEKIFQVIQNGGQIETTSELVEVIKSVTGYKPWQKTHPATKVFQALRIAVNDEYNGIQDLLSDGFKLLSTGGRICIITFHSGEDRIVKKYFAKLKQNGVAKIIRKIKPGETEIRNNRRSRSAILRTVEKL